MKFSNNLQWFVQYIFQKKIWRQSWFRLFEDILNQIWEQNQRFLVKNLVIWPINFELSSFTRKPCVSSYIYSWSYFNVPYQTAIFLTPSIDKNEREVFRRKLNIVSKLTLRNQHILSFSIKPIPLPELEQRRSVFFRLKLILLIGRVKILFNFTMVENWNRSHIIKEFNLVTLPSWIDVTSWQLIFREFSTHSSVISAITFIKNGPNFAPPRLFQAPRLLKSMNQVVQLPPTPLF